MDDQKRFWVNGEVGGRRIPGYVPKNPCTAAPIGSGPEDETCGSCRHYTRAELRSGRIVLKCGLMRSFWTHGAGSDVKARWPACRAWEAKEDGECDSGDGSGGG